MNHLGPGVLSVPATNRELTKRRRKHLFVSSNVDPQHDPKSLQAWIFTALNVTAVLLNSLYARIPHTNLCFCERTVTPTSSFYLCGYHHESSYTVSCVSGFAKREYGVLCLVIIE